MINVANFNPTIVKLIFLLAEILSCSAYECKGDFVPGQPCQCNLSCQDFGDCCPDFFPVCLPDKTVTTCYISMLQVILFHFESEGWLKLAVEQIFCKTPIFKPLKYYIYTTVPNHTIISWFQVHALMDDVERVMTQAIPAIATAEPMCRI